MMKFKSKGHGQIILSGAQGRKRLANVLLTFRSPDFHKAYVLLYPASESNHSDLGIRAYVLPAGTDPADLTQGSLTPVKSKSEWDMIESVLNTFLRPQ